MGYVTVCNGMGLFGMGYYKKVMEGYRIVKLDQGQFVLVGNVWNGWCGMKYYGMVEKCMVWQEML